MEFISFHLPHNRISWNSVWKHGNAWQSFSESGCLISFMFCIALQISNIYDHRISSKESKWKEVFVCNFFFLMIPLYPWAFPHLCLITESQPWCFWQVISLMHLTEMDCVEDHWIPCFCLQVIRLDVSSPGLVPPRLLHPHNPHDNYESSLWTHTFLGRWATPFARNPTTFITPWETSGQIFVCQNHKSV